MRIRNNRAMGIVIGGTICFLVFAFLGIQTARAQEKVQLTGLDIALKILPFVESMPEGKDGLLIFRQICNADGCAVLNMTARQGRIWPVLAYAGLYEATQEIQYLDKMKTTMDQLIQDCEPPDSTTSGDCRFLGVQAEAAHRVTGDDRYLGYISMIKDDFPIYTASTSSGAMLSAIMMRQAVLAYQHGFHDNFALIQTGIRYLYGNLGNRATLASFDDVPFKKTACWAYAAETEMYRSLQGKNENEILYRDITVGNVRSALLTEPKRFFKKFKFSDLSPASSLYLAPLTDLEPCVESLLNLYEITQDAYYKNQAFALLQRLLDNHWDSEYAPKFNGDNALLAQGCRDGHGGLACYNNSKVITDNAYAVYLFSRLPNETFSITPSVPVTYFAKPQVDPELTQQPKEPLLKRLYLFFIVILAGVLIFVMYRFYQKTRQNKESDFDDKNSNMK